MYLNQSQRLGVLTPSLLQKRLFSVTCSMKRLNDKLEEIREKNRQIEEFGKAWLEFYESTSGNHPS